jgi:hypothetical protein
MHLLPSVAKQPNLELKTRPKQLLGSLLLVITLPGQLVCVIIILMCASQKMDNFVCSKKVHHLALAAVKTDKLTDELVQMS